MILEICANSFKSAINAERGGADRIELCIDLELGGLTPSNELIQTVKNNISIPVFVLIRPIKGSFVYDLKNMNKMLHSIHICKELGCDGIVSGILTTTNQIDIEGTQKLIEAAHPLPFTFHRAFDQVLDPEKSLQELISLGVSRLLTSGQESTALDGLELLNRLKEQAANRLIVMPGGSVRHQNAKVFKSHGFSEIHSSALRTIHHPLNDDITNGPNKFRSFGTSDVVEIRKIKSLIN